jgi:gamma-glutamyltranspeptidase
LAETLELLGENGSDVFYTGVIGREILKAVREGINPNSRKYGLMEITDLISYRPVFREALQSTYRGHTVFGFPPPSSGASPLSPFFFSSPFFFLLPFLPFLPSF